MPMEEHLTVDQLAIWKSLPNAYPVRYAYHLSTGCDLCWSAIAAVEPTEPRRLKDPFLRAIATTLDQALNIYGLLGFEVDFLETWKVLDRIDRDSRSRISDRAYKAFGQEVAHGMVREVSGLPDQAEKGKVLV